MNKVAVLIPTYKRSGKLEKFIKDFNSVTTQATLYFIISPEDPTSREILERLGQNYYVYESEYVGAINFGYKRTEEEFVLCGADDIVFYENWDTELLKLAEDPTKHIFGGVDEWKISKTLKHISHPMVRRAHYDSPLYFEDYIHYMCDIEFVQRGFKEDCVSITPKMLIGHPHTFVDGTVPEKWDATYQKSFSKIEYDNSLYHRRRGEFEMWDFDELQDGRVVPTKLNPLYNKTLVSIVIPSYNDADFLKVVLNSIAENTFYRYEIIIINNGSDAIQKTQNPWDMINTHGLLDNLVSEDQSCPIRVIHWEENKWVNPAWNYGAKIAEGDYIAIINSDIEVSKDWDKYLVAALEMPLRKFTISCPFETNPYEKTPYSLDSFFRKHVPHMIKGPCFMFRRKDVDALFPIPEQIKHWCGDNWLADKANALGGVAYARKAQIYHHITQSGKRVAVSKLSNRTYQDLLEYEKLTGKDMSWIKNRFPEVIRDFHVDESKSDQD